MKKGLWMVSLWIVLCLMLAACGASEPAPTETSNQTNNAESAATPESAESPSPAAEPATKVYTHIKGDTEIPVNPQRILAPFPHYAHLEALGLKSIGAITYAIENDMYSNMSEMADIGAFNMEAVLDLQPDLIIVNEGMVDQYEELSKIAPTVIIPVSLNLIDSMRAVGEVVGKEAEAEAWIENMQAQAAAAKQKLGQVIAPDETVSIINVRPKNILIYSNTNLGGDILYNYLGLKAPAIIQKDVIEGGEWPDISEEAIAEYAGDHIFIAGTDADDRMKEIRNSALWKSLPAVKKGQVYELDFNQFYWHSPTSVEDQIETLLDMILKANQ